MGPSGRLADRPQPSAPKA
ncbi:Protein of unknown function [Propionibacterium freudenreichii]|nr:Protein of unknown function [Propionibacterium freudenreichii]